MATVNPPVELEHKLLGRCQLVRTEGVTWVVRRIDTTAEYFIPPGRRGEFRTLAADVKGTTACPTEALSSKLEFPGPVDVVGASQRASLPELTGTPRGTSNTAFVSPDVESTGIGLWASLECWIKGHDPRGEGNAVLCRRIRDARLSGRDLSQDERTSALLLLQEATRDGFQVSENQLAESTAIEGEAVSGVEDDDDGPGPADQRTPTAIRMKSAASVSTGDVSLGLPNNLELIDPRLLKRVVESLRTGLPPQRVSERYIAVGLDHLSDLADQFLRKTAQSGAALVIRGSYGNGKTFTLRLVEEVALESGFAVVRTEIDAAENKLDKPNHLYRSLISSLRLPGIPGKGGRVLVEKAFALVSDVCDRLNSDRNSRGCARIRRCFLNEHIQCEPLAWLLSDPRLLDKPKLVSLFCGENHGTPGQARSCHVLPSGAHDWPAFSAGTQGDLGSYLLSGLGRLCRLLGFQGLVVILDEMEKWQDLDWKAQARAGNMLGGLIWGATAAVGRRECRKQTLVFYGGEGASWQFQGAGWEGCDHPQSLGHSRSCGGSRFTTPSTCHLGLAIAMTPRGVGPEHEWKQYGLLDIVDLPQFGLREFLDCFEKTKRIFVQAYGLATDAPSDVLAAAFGQWRLNDDYSPRNAVIAIVETLDRWRESLLA